MNKKRFFKFLRENRMFLLMLFVTPGFFWTITKPVQLIKEWANYPSYLSQKVHNIYSPQHLKYVEDLRWSNVAYTGSDFKSRLFYNKATILVDEFFDYTTFASPRFFFQSGGGSIFSPVGVEPIFGFSFLLFVLGLVYLLKTSNFKLFYAIGVFSLIAYSAGHRNLAYLMPVTILYVYIVYLGIDKYIKKRSIAVGIYVICSLFLLGRSLWLV